MNVWEEGLLSTVAQMTGTDPVLKTEMVTLSYQDLPPSGRFRIVAIFESAETCEMFFRLVVPLEERYRYRVMANKSILVL